MIYGGKLYEVNEKFRVNKLFHDPYRDGTERSYTSGN